MILEKFTTPGMGENIYLVGNDKQVVLIDPGAEMPRIDKIISEHGYDLKAIVLTHGHCDHIAGVEYYRDKYRVEVYVPFDDQEMIEQPKLNLSGPVFGKDISIMGSIVYSDKEVLTFDKIVVEAIHTPGHTMGSSCLVINGSIFSGDTLFKMGVGRWDLYGGDEYILMDSIKSKLFTREDAPVYPGHGVRTSIRYEREHNPFVR